MITGELSFIHSDGLDKKVIMTVKSYIIRHILCSHKVMKYNRHPLLRIPVISNFRYSLALLVNCPYKFVSTLGKLPLQIRPVSQTFTMSDYFLGSFSAFKGFFHPLSQMFSFHSFECLKSTFENFDRMFTFSCFNTITC